MGIILKKQEEGTEEISRIEEIELTEVERRALGDQTEMVISCSTIYRRCHSQNLEEQIQPFGSYNVKIISSFIRSLIF
jgi:hypothetical protein